MKYDVTEDSYTECGIITDVDVEVVEALFRVLWERICLQPENREPRSKSPHNPFLVSTTKLSGALILWDTT